MQVSSAVRPSQKTAKNLKQSLRQIALSIPVLSDCYLYYWVFPRSSSTCRGKFSSYSNALKAIPQQVQIDYNQPEFYSAHHTLSAEEIAKFQPIDYPVLVWLRQAFTDSSTVFDWGGNTGYSYYAYQKYLPYPSQLSWKICELPEAVKAGNEIAQRIHSPGLSYTTDTADAEGAEIFLTCGALQYLQLSLAELLLQLSAKPHHLIVHHIPLHSGEQYFTLQNIIESHVPYKVQNYAEFVTSLTSLGYELVDSWEIARTCHIPFHPECFVSAYYGFYLRLENPDQSNDSNYALPHQSIAQRS